MRTSPPLPDRAQIQRRTLFTLVVSQIPGALGIGIGVVTASLLARELSGSERMAGLAQTSQVLGAAIFSWILALWMHRRGRRVGLAGAYLVGTVGALLIVSASVMTSMTILLIGALLLGATSSANLAARYSAADLATDEARGKALSWVMWATTIGAVAGPNLTGLSEQLATKFSISINAGPFIIATAGMAASGLIVWIWLRPDPLFLARRYAEVTDPALSGQVTGAAVTAAASGGAPAEPDPSPKASQEEITSPPPAVATVTPPLKLRQVLQHRPVLIAAIVGMAMAHAVMVSVMVMTPLHMERGGADLRIIGLVISIHILGMYAFAPLMGACTDRFGAGFTLGAGGVVLLISLAFTALSPEGSSAQIYGGLFLLGVGWSMATVAAATLITIEAPLMMRTQVQGSADLVMSFAAAGGSALSGVIVEAWGFPVLSIYAAVFAAAVVVAAALGARLRGVPAEQLGQTQSTK